ncbi:cofactor-independent phosphoglycerate mutase [Maridesulfovibrio bastinii]|uniref:cofactor-independent phosphoglycerate mutase n=1 Tax=Maridesulfovibrio bastinii TaxID=47157 RepID=UPI000417D157|nr:cofactor-independent phosphoglycerate mutase [Maridesulfovibrio bastinii]
MKLLFLIEDGMGGWPLDELNNKTTLEAARTPNMDKLARKSIMGRCKTVPDGMAPGSDIANMSLLGFDPLKYHTGRGPIEAAAQGLDLDKDDLVFRMNLVNLTSLDENGTMLDYSSGHISSEVSIPIVEKLQRELGSELVRFYPGIQYRHLLVIKGGAKLAENDIEIRPPHDLTNKSIAEDVAAFKASKILEPIIFKAHEILKNSGTKAVSIWPWGQGKPLNLPNFKDKFKRTGAVISAVDLVKGLGRASGLEVIEIEGATGLVDTNYEGKMKAAVDFLSRGDFVFLHLEGPDESGHMGSVKDKIASIERFDSLVLGPLYEKFGSDCAFLIACDHFTPIKIRTHDAEPVPFMLNYPGSEDSGLDSFSEKNSASTGLNINKGDELMEWVLKRIS